MIKITRSVVSFLKKIPEDEPIKLTKLLDLKESEKLKPFISESYKSYKSSIHLRDYVYIVLEVLEGIHHYLSSRVVRPSKPGPLRFVAGEVLEKIHSNGGYMYDNEWKVTNVLIGLGLLCYGCKKRSFFKVRDSEEFEKVYKNYLNSAKGKVYKSFGKKIGKIGEKGYSLENMTRDIVPVLERNSKINSSSVLEALGIDKPSENLCRRVKYVLSVLGEDHRNPRARSDSNVRSCARGFVNFIHQCVGSDSEDSKELVRWRDLVEACEERDKNGKRRNVFYVRSILVGAGIIEYIESKDGCFVSIKNKDKFEKLRDSLNSKTLKNIVIKKEKNKKGD